MGLPRMSADGSLNQPYTVSVVFLSDCFFIVRIYVCMVITYNKSKDQPGKVANPARGQLNRENEFFPVPVPA